MTLLLLLCSTNASRRAVSTTKSSSSKIVNSFVGAFSPPTATTRRSTSTTRVALPPASSSSSTSSLKASFFDELSRTFSTMTTDGGGGKSQKYYTVGITGASGLVGTALRDELSSPTTTVRGKPVRVVALGRTDGPTTLSTTIGEDLDDDDDDSVETTSFKALWNPNASTTSEIIDPKLVEKLDAIVHLSGENISTGLSGPLKLLGIRPWTDAKKQEIIDSRVVTTNALANAIAAASPNKKNQIDFIVSSGIGIYGSDFIEGQNDESTKLNNPPDETSDTDSATGFLADVSRKWEDATKPASSAARRVVNLRTAVVMSTKGGALAKLYPIFFLGGGGIVGNGKQYFPHISARDMARATVHVLDTPSLKGPVNMIAPDNGCTNQEFTTAMGKVLNRPTVLPFPAFAVSLLFGEMGEEVLLGGTRATPQKLLKSGFQFLHPTIEDTVRSAIIEEKNI
eukprot:CAMPEP_0113459610 /NCGR_PEP_ID=MMETSP0014_2-20120614/10543_1 /TAXON_ID=2857 /ORGANISM="Nitzschia sp." /LENGTH=454 /DNA_ID=CAMNT_0000351203 /DNA_START=154 /DNA_END=1518 /DNA_ORIENTATION=- /assembly_acc=CAM_ASM_000159